MMVRDEVAAVCRERRVYVVSQANVGRQILGSSFEARDARKWFRGKHVKVVWLLWSEVTRQGFLSDGRIWAYKLIRFHRR